MKAYVGVQQRDEKSALYYGPFESVFVAKIAAEQFKKRTPKYEFCVNVWEEADLFATYEQYGPATVVDPSKLGEPQ